MGGASALLFGSSFLMLFAVSADKNIAEWYSETIYPFWVNSIGKFFGLFPFSAAEIGFYVFMISCLFFTCRFFGRILRRKQRPHEISNAVLHILMTASILFFIFTLMCGLNYQRMSFSEKYSLKTGTYSAKQLADVCRTLTNDVNYFGTLVQRDEEGCAVWESGSGEEQEEAVRSMQKLGQTYPALQGYYPKPKGLLFSEFLSVQNLTGMYLPFTVEANYNKDMTAYNIPFTMCHELSHLRGFMQEEEANFIAYLACMESERPEFGYSGSLLGWIYCMNVLEEADPDLYKEVRAALLPQVEQDLEANSRFWEHYEGKVSEMSNKVNDTYLKANGQKDGVESYDRMVDLMVAYFGEDGR